MFNGRIASLFIYFSCVRETVDLPRRDGQDAIGAEHEGTDGVDEETVAEPQQAISPSGRVVLSSR